ncbi:disease resistance protein RPS2-like [Chenopodium quinoa]|uniref:AAA+ ATPase domain-containing protein n=1 Tax=Chenopodium quinoa TaxID=63459 RepID=A0A803MGD0_CHEQI|nr:disease resistance protein RPS2-like [Chenopodium quinoa]
MENLLTPLVSFTDSVYMSIAKRVNHYKNFQQRIRGMVDKLEELKDTRDDLKREIEQAEFQGLMSTKQIKGWLERVEKAEAEANLVLAQPIKQLMCCRQPSCRSRYRLSKKALQKETEISELITKKTTLDVLVQGLPQIDPIPCVPTFGLNSALEMAVQNIADDGAGMIGIYGIGGVGKTTFLKEINNEYISRSDEFEAVIWVTVSKDYSLERIQRALISRLGLSFDAAESQEQLTSRIYSFLRRIKFLLLLDDLWRRLDLENIGIPLPDKTNRCKVLFTTRSMDVCSDMDANTKLKVDFLNEEHSWCLFCDKANQTDIINNSDLKPYAEAIVKRCGGLPLALITIGRAMANRKTEEEWKYAIEALDNAPSELRGMQDVFTILKFSYENLQDDTLKICFLYCALFPGDYPLEKEQLIDYWIGEGYLDGSNEDSLHNKGHAVIGSLKVACLLESGEDDTQIKMHEIVRSFAVWIASYEGKNMEKVVVQGCSGLSELPDVKKWKVAEKISLLGNEITMLTAGPVCLNLSSLLLHWNRSLSKISNEFFHYMPVLKVLDLSVTSIKEVPASIGQLVELRYLDLSRTKITALPEDIGRLSKLRHLDLQRTHSLRKIPRKAILQLKNLRVLNLYYSYGEWDMSHNEGEGLMKFEDLQYLNLTALGITMTEFSALTKLSSFYNILDCIQYLFIKGCEGLIYLMVATVYGGGERLRRLNIYGCCTLKEIDLGSEAGKDWLPSLEVLSLHALPNLTTIWRNSASPKCHKNLRYINIWYCPKLKNVSWILQLPRLEKLYVFYCEEIEEIIGENDVTGGSLELPFLSLKTISFRGLPKLKSISKEALSFPVLNTIALIECPQLKKLPSAAYNSSDFPIVYCSREWWENLEWDIAAASSALHPQFIAI